MTSRYNTSLVDAMADIVQKCVISVNDVCCVQNGIVGHKHKEVIYLEQDSYSAIH